MASRTSLLRHEALLVSCFLASVHLAIASPTAAQNRPGAPAAPQPASPVLTRAPELVHFVPADYPAAENEAGREAAVTLALTLDVEGRVTDATVVESAGEAFDAAAVAAARQFLFRPAEVDGKPSAIRILYRYEFTIAREAVTTSILEGRVQDRASKGPLAGVRITIEGETLDAPRETSTDEGGRFRFEDIPAGPLRVRLERDDLTPVMTSETLGEGERMEVVYSVELPSEDEEDGDEDDMEIVVVAPTVRREVVATAIRADEGRKVPGTSGDVVRVVESMPGVARAAAGSGALVVWGAAPGDTRVYLDGVPIPRLYHEGGLRSVVHPAFVDSIQLLPGGYGATFGRGLGGVVFVETKTAEKDQVGGTVSLDPLDASATLRSPIGSRGQAAVAGRYSVIDRWTEQALSDDVRELVPIPRYWDGQVRTRFQLVPKEHVDLIAIGSSDRYARGVPNADPALVTRERRSLDFQRIYARYVNESSDGSATTIVPFVGFSRSRFSSSFGDVEAAVANRTTLVGVRANRRIRAASILTVDVGIDTEVSFVALDRQGALALPPREGDIRVFGQPPPDQIGADTWNVTQIGVAPYVEADLALAGGKVHVLPGLRLDPYIRSVSRRTPPEARIPAIGAFEEDFSAEPRLAVRYDPLERLGFHAAVGLYRQMPAPEDLSAAFGNPLLPVSKGTHYVAGVKSKLTEKLGLDVTGFLTRSHDLAMRSPAASPLRAQALEPVGQGRAYGAQVMLRQELAAGFFGWVAYTWMRSERKDFEEAAWRLFDFDQTHVLTAVAAYELPLGLELSTRFRYATGFPRTPVLGATYDARRSRYQPVFGEHNSIRIPDFVQLDVRLAKSFAIGDTELDVFLEVLNVWNRQNAEEIVFSPDFSQRGFISGFPILPLLGAQWTF